jgi:hypothetical protein
VDLETAAVVDIPATPTSPSAPTIVGENAMDEDATVTDLVTVTVDLVTVNVKAMAAPALVIVHLMTVTAIAIVGGIAALGEILGKTALLTSTSINSINSSYDSGGRLVTTISKTMVLVARVRSVILEHGVLLVPTEARSERTEF